MQLPQTDKHTQITHNECMWREFVQRFLDTLRIRIVALPDVDCNSGSNICDKAGWHNAASNWILGFKRACNFIYTTATARGTERGTKRGTRRGTGNRRARQLSTMFGKLLLLLFTAELKQKADTENTRSNAAYKDNNNNKTSTEKTPRKRAQYKRAKEGEKNGHETRNKQQQQRRKTQFGR